MQASKAKVHELMDERMAMRKPRGKGAQHITHGHTHARARVGGVGWA